MSDHQLEQLRDLVRQHPQLIWYSTSYDTMSAETVVEAVLNYGNWDEVSQLNQIMGLKTARNMFHKLSSRKRSNFHPLVKNYFSLYYARHTF